LEGFWGPQLPWLANPKQLGQSIRQFCKGYRTLLAPGAQFGLGGQLLQKRLKADLAFLELHVKFRAQIQLSYRQHGVDDLIEIALALQEIARQLVANLLLTDLKPELMPPSPQGQLGLAKTLLLHPLLNDRLTLKTQVGQVSLHLPAQLEFGQRILFLRQGRQPALALVLLLDFASQPEGLECFQGYGGCRRGKRVVHQSTASPVLRLPGGQRSARVDRFDLQTREFEIIGFLSLQAYRCSLADPWNPGLSF